MATLQTIDGEPLSWPDLKAMNEAWWERPSSEPLLQGDKFRTSDIVAIRALVDRGNTYGVIALDYHVAYETIARIARRDTYAGIT